MALHHVEAVMGTMVSIDIADSHDRSLIDEAVAWFHEVDDVFSPYLESSTISRIGRGELAPTDAAVSDDVRAVLQRCGELSELTDGVFDVWSLPSPNGTNFDPCGYVKGWSVERAVDLLTSRGVSDCCVNAGGDVVVVGRAHGGVPWTVGVRHPDDPLATALVVAGGERLAVATSGTYERGTHIVDPRTGRQVDHVASATVIGPDLGDADAFATTLFIMGVDGLRWLDGIDGYSGCVITHDRRVVMTEEFRSHRAA